MGCFGQYRWLPASSQFELDVVGVTQDYERPAAPSVKVLDTRVGHSVRIEMLGPGLKNGQVVYMERDVIKADTTLVKGSSFALSMRYGRDSQPAWMEHRPALIARLLPSDEELETNHLLPPSNSSVAMSDGQVQVPKSTDLRCGHGEILAATD
jgi:hypothetical protein